MRLPTNDITPPTVVENRYEIRQTDAATPVRPVAPHAAATQTYFPKRPRRDQQGGGQSGGGQAGGGQAGGGQAGGGQAEDRRTSDDRRQTGRRAADDPVILDTRVGLDRRASPRREGDVGGQTIDEFA